MHHFFVSKEAISGGEVLIMGEDYHHAVRVLRVKPGEKLMISDDSGRDLLCEVMDTVNVSAAGTKRDALKLGIVSEYPGGHELPIEVTLFQSVIKGEKMELLIEKAVELGVSCIVPVISRYTVVRMDDPARLEARTRRWQARAESAAKQAKRSIIPAVSKPLSFKEALDLMDRCDIRLIAYELADRCAMTDILNLRIKDARSIGVMIGPEGGFHPEEIELAKAGGLSEISLGRRILRAETAAIAALSAVMLSIEKEAIDA